MLCENGFNTSQLYNIPSKLSRTWVHEIHTNSIELYLTHRVYNIYNGMTNIKYLHIQKD